MAAGWVRKILEAKIGVNIGNVVHERTSCGHWRLNRKLLQSSEVTILRQKKKAYSNRTGLSIVFTFENATMV